MSGAACVVSPSHWKQSGDSHCYGPASARVIPCIPAQACSSVRRRSMSGWKLRPCCCSRHSRKIAAYSGALLVGMCLRRSRICRCLRTLEYGTIFMWASPRLIGRDAAQPHRIPGCQSVYIQPCFSHRQSRADQRDLGRQAGLPRPHSSRLAVVHAHDDHGVAVELAPGRGPPGPPGGGPPGLPPCCEFPVPSVDTSIPMGNVAA